MTSSVRKRALFCLFFRPRVVLDVADLNFWYRLRGTHADRDYTPPSRFPPSVRRVIAFYVEHYFEQYLPKSARSARAVSNEQIQKSLVFLGPKGRFVVYAKKKQKREKKTKATILLFLFFVFFCI